MALDTDRRLFFSLPYFGFRTSVSVLRLPHFSVFHLPPLKFEGLQSYVSRVSDQLSDKLTFGRLFQANKKSSTFRSCANLYTYLRTICNPNMNLQRYCFEILRANETSVRKLQFSDDTINFRTLLIPKLERSVELPNLVGRYSHPSPHKVPNFGFCCTCGYPGWEVPTWVRGSLLGLDRLCSSPCLLFYSLIPKILTHYALQFTYYAFQFT